MRTFLTADQTYYVNCTTGSDLGILYNEALSVGGASATGGGGGHNTMQPSTFMNIMTKL